MLKGVISLPAASANTEMRRMWCAQDAHIQDRHVREERMGRLGVEAGWGLSREVYATPRPCWVSQVMKRGTRLEDY